MQKLGEKEGMIIRFGAFYCLSALSLRIFLHSGNSQSIKKAVLLDCAVFKHCVTSLNGIC